MSREELIGLVEQGREIEFVFKEKKFSITYVRIDDKELISFCEFYKRSTEVSSVDELLMIERYGVTVEAMLGAITENDVWIF